MQAGTAEEGERYLGALLFSKGSAKRTGEQLLNKIKAKLAGWKTNMLSHAGRLVLLKSVLMSIPVYHMSIECLPKRIIKEINSLMAKFFWGKTGQSRYMALVAWKNICKPIEDGGLAVRDLNNFGEALLSKLVWSVISEEDRLWVQVCKAKYCPKIGIWKAKNHSNSSQLWKQVIRLRDTFKHAVFWKLGDGSKAKARDQPWFQGWDSQPDSLIVHTSLHVADLFDFDMNQWKMHELNRIFQPNQVVQIVNADIKPVIQEGAQDKLIWSESKSGKYTVREGYKYLNSLTQTHTNTPVSELWSVAAEWKGLVPKVKIFLWRVIAGALMVAQNMHRRINKWSPLCQRCQMENEYESHCFFFCPGSRSVWFASNLGLRTDHLSLNIIEAIKQCTQGRNEYEIKVFSYTLWELWKARNATVIQLKKFDPMEITQKVRIWLQLENQMGEALPHKVVIQGTQEKYGYKQGGWQIITDGSWDTTLRAGGAHVLYCQGQMVRIGYNCYQLHDPFHAEVLAMKDALFQLKQLWEAYGIGEIQVFSDCKVLVNLIREGDMQDVPSWRACEDVLELLKIISQFPVQVECTEVQRQVVHEAHDLANYARLSANQYNGEPRPYVDVERNTRQNLDNIFFQRVQDEPP
ncbi:RNA-directed DNA polymerase (reverse transcriptase)-related family protein [Rhynchospora pubera]|uniref:RNA-directed DNA polymerase (Reverse transcriptase)-related family protein n=1 Tax=Rhynchospora pubera TaxID=906938 RepID=A0AAV8HYP4_9POAL|nr:RNA-directed DNA polymerase (reverse transcriptase)-related family protein [Rhynchospora pubera]